MTDVQYAASEPKPYDCPACGGSGVMEGECICGEDTCVCANPVPPDCILCEGLAIIMGVPRDD